MPNTRSSTRNAAMVPAANTSSERRTAASRSPTRNARVKPSRKKRKTAPGEVPAPTEVLEAVPSNGEPEGNNKVIDTASTEIVVAVPSNDEPEVNEKVIDTAPAKAPEAGQWGRLDDHNCANVDDAHMGDEGSEDASQFADHTTVGYYDYDDMGEALPPPRRTWPSLSARPSRSLSPASPSKPLQCSNSRSRSITVSAVSPGAISRRSRSRTLSRSNASDPSPPRAVSRGRSRSPRTGIALSPQPPMPRALHAEDAPQLQALPTMGAAPHPPARGPSPLRPADTRPPVSQPKIAPAPDSPHRSPTRTRNGGRPRPERSHSPSRDLSSDDSTDEYGRTQEAKRRLEAARVARGYSPAAASNADDEDDLQDYLAEVATHGFRDDDTGRKSGRKSTTDKSTRKSKAKAVVATNGKGKGRAAPPAAALDPEPTDPNPDEVVEEDLMQRGYTPGPIPRQILDKLHALEEEHDVKVAALAASCNKDPATLRRATIPHELRNTSAWNMYLAYHAVHHPKPQGVAVAQFNIDARRAFEALLPGLSKAEMGKTLFAKKAAEPLIQMAKHLSNSWGLHIFAVAIDPRGGDSFAFAGSREMEQVRLVDGSSISGFMGDLETKIRVIQMEERGEDTSRLYIPRPTKNSNQTTNKPKRDVYRSSFGTIMGDRLTKMCFNARLITAEQVKTATMVWNEKFLDLAFRGKFRIVNYPLALENIGQVIGAEQFNTKVANVKEYNSFMPALEHAVKQGTDEDPEGEPVIRIVPWEPAERDRQLEDQEEVPLVVSTDGCSLRLVQHSPVYGAAVAEAAQRRAQRRAEKRKAEGGKLKVTHRPRGHVPRLPPTLNPKTPHRPLDHGIPILLPLVRLHSQDVRQVECGLTTTLDLKFLLANRVYNRSKRPLSRGQALRDPITTSRLSESLHSPDVFSSPLRLIAPMCDRRNVAAQMTMDTIRWPRPTWATASTNIARPHLVIETRRRKPPIAMRLAINAQRSEIFYATKFQPTSRPRLRDRHTYYYNTDEEKWRPIPEGMEPVLLSREDRESA
ncbi:hypothetical protein B0H14DRAFT_3504146 [Mycena olivaceomarginata]|nr:hypothetical protein B0H14DRAFT_3504146 [Mycena olivaceomarginata]